MESRREAVTVDLAFPVAVEMSAGAHRPAGLYGEEHQPPPLTAAGRAPIRVHGAERMGPSCPGGHKQAQSPTAHVKSSRGPRRQGQDAEHQAGANTDRQHLRCVPPFTGCQLVNEDRASPQGQLSQYRGSSPALALNRVQDRQLFRLDLSALPLSVLKPHFLDFW